MFGVWQQRRLTGWPWLFVYLSHGLLTTNAVAVDCRNRCQFTGDQYGRMLFEVPTCSAWITEDQYKDEINDFLQLRRSRAAEGTGLGIYRRHRLVSASY